MIQLLGRVCGHDASTWKRGISSAKAGGATRAIANNNSAARMSSSRSGAAFLAAADQHTSTRRCGLRPPRPSLGADAGRGGDVAPFPDVAPDALGDCLGWTGLAFHALRDERLLALGRGENLVHLAVEPREDRGWR